MQKIIRKQDIFSCPNEFGLVNLGDGQEKADISGDYIKLKMGNWTSSHVEGIFKKDVEKVKNDDF